MFPSEKVSPFIRVVRQPWATLFLNHMDAWGCTLAIAATAVVLHDALTWSAAYLVGSITAGYWLAFAINDYFDASADARDPHKAAGNFFVRATLPPAVYLAGFGGISVLILPGFTQFGWRGAAVVPVCLFIMWGYSMPPLRFKSRPGLDLLIHALFVQTFPYLLCVYLLPVDWLPIDTALVPLGLLTSLTAQLEQQIRDAAVDTAHGEDTFALRIGPERALVVLKVATAVSLVYALAHIIIGTIPPAVAPLGLIAVPAVIPRFWRRPNQPRPEKLIRRSLYVGLAYLMGLLMVVGITSGLWGP